MSALTAAIALARARDAIAFDQLALMAADPSKAPDVQQMANVTMDSIIQEMTYVPLMGPNAAGCMDGPSYPRPYKSIKAYEGQLSSKVETDRVQAAYCLGRPADLVEAGESQESARYAMDALFASMMSDPDLVVRWAAHNSFRNVGGWIHPSESMSSVLLFRNAANRQWWRENRGRFLPEPARIRGNVGPDR